MKNIEKLTVRFHHMEVGTLSLTPDNKRCAFEYSKNGLVEGFSISLLELPLKQGLFIAEPQPFYGNFGIFEDSLPDGYGRYLLHKALLREGIDDRNFSALDRLSLVGNRGMGALTYEPHTHIQMEEKNTTLTSYRQKLWRCCKSDKIRMPVFCYTIAGIVAVVVPNLEGQRKAKPSLLLFKHNCYICIA